MEKQLYNSYLDGVEDYGLTAEQEYQSTQAYDFMRCFEAGYSLSQKQKKEHTNIDCSTSLLQKLQQILFTHYGMRDMLVDIYTRDSQVVTLVLDLPIKYNEYYNEFQASDEYKFHVLTYYPDMTKVKLSAILLTSTKHY